MTVALPLASFCYNLHAHLKSKIWKIWYQFRGISFRGARFHCFCLLKYTFTMIISYFLVPLASFSLNLGSFTLWVTSVLRFICSFLCCINSYFRPLCLYQFSIRCKIIYKINTSDFKLNKKTRDKKSIFSIKFLFAFIHFMSTIYLVF